MNLGFTTADTIYDLKDWGGSAGGSGGTGISVGLDVIVGEGFWGLQVGVGGSVPPIPIEFHGGMSHTTIYDLKEWARDFSEAQMFSACTVGEAYAYSFMWTYMMY
jgi:hypothetical protein